MLRIAFAYKDVITDSDTLVDDAQFDDTLTTTQLLCSGVIVMVPVTNITVDKGTCLNGENYSHILSKSKDFEVTISANELDSTALSFMNAFYNSNNKFISFSDDGSAWGNYIEVVTEGGRLPITYINNNRNLPEIAFKFSKGKTVMTEVNFNAIAGLINLAPIQSAQFKYITSGVDDDEPITIDNFINIWNLESDSNFKITSVTRETDLGTVVTLGYNYEVNLILPQNDFYSANDIQLMLELLTTTKFILYLNLGTAAMGNSIDSTIRKNNSTTAITLSFGYGEDVSLNYEIESVEYRPHISAHIKGFQKDIHSYIIEN